MASYSVIADRADYRIAVLTCDLCRSAYQDFTTVAVGLTVGQACTLCKEGAENRAQADLRLREIRIRRTRVRH